MLLWVHTENCYIPPPPLAWPGLIAGLKDRGMMDSVLMANEVVEDLKKYDTLQEKVLLETQFLVSKIIKLVTNLIKD